MSISSQIQTLTQLFSSNAERFEVPAYQRRYSWKIKQVNALFQDILSLSEIPENNDVHLFGMIILHKPNINNNIIEVVDGQQRLTTITILLKAIKDAYLSLGNTIKANQVGAYLQVPIFGQHNDLNKLTLGNLDQTDYNELLTGHTVHSFSNVRIRDAKLFFDQKFQSFNEQDLDNFCMKLLNIAVIVRLDITDIKDAYKLFETFNNRGLALSAADLIKNLLLGQASKIDGGTYLDEVKRLWAQIIFHLDKVDKDDPDVFFRRYFSSVLKKKITKNSLIDEFKAFYVKNVQDNDRITLMFGENGSEEEDENEFDLQATDLNGANATGNISIIGFLKDILKAAETYRKLCFAQFNDPLINDEVKRLNDIQSDTSYTFLMQFMQQDVTPEFKKEVIKMVATLMLRRHICGKQTGENDTIFARLVRCIDEIANRQVFFECLYQSLTAPRIYPSDEEFKNYLQTYNGFKNASLHPRARILLDTYNTSLNGDLRQPETADASIHQIIPEILTNDWQNYLGDGANVRVFPIVNTLGNLTLVSNGQIELVNPNAPNPFLRMQPTYADDILILTNTEIANMFDFRLHEVASRGENIAEVVKNYWTIQPIDINMFNLPPAGGTGILPIQPNNPVDQIVQDRDDHGVNPNLFLVPGTAKNIETSIHQSVDIELALDYLPEELLIELIYETGGIYCFAVAQSRIGIWNDLRNGDIVLISQRNTGKFNYLGKVFAKCDSVDFGENLWPIAGGEPWRYIYFLKDIREIDLDKTELLVQLGFQTNYNLPGPNLIKSNDQRLINFRENNYYRELFED